MRWLAEQVDKGTLPFDRIHSALSIEQTAQQWLEHNLSLLPAHCRPSSEDLPAFANLFASYLVTSFDFVAEPNKRKVSECGCMCEWCTRLVSLSHLQPKKLLPADKKRAHLLEVRYVKDLARQLNASLADDVAESIAADDALREPLSLATYGQELERRLAGSFTGPEVLALWRRFAWTRQGSPKKEFSLEASAVFAAQEQVANAIRTRVNRTS